MAVTSTNNNAAAAKARLNSSDEFDAKIVLLGDSGMLTNFFPLLLRELYYYIGYLLSTTDV